MHSTVVRDGFHKEGTDAAAQTVQHSGKSLLEGSQFCGSSFMGVSEWVCWDGAMEIYQVALFQKLPPFLTLRCGVCIKLEDKGLLLLDKGLKIARPRNVLRGFGCRIPLALRCCHCCEYAVIPLEAALAWQTWYAVIIVSWWTVVRDVETLPTKTPHRVCRWPLWGRWWAGISIQYPRVDRHRGKLGVRRSLLEVDLREGLGRWSACTVEPVSFGGMGGCPCGVCNAMMHWRMVDSSCFCLGGCGCWGRRRFLSIFGLHDCVVVIAELLCFC